jgi:serine/threonine protein kinase, bacterial
LLNRRCRGVDVDGTPFGRYLLMSLLGQGGMGEVWRAHDTDTDRVVAIKLLPTHFSANEDFQRRFRREAHAAARLNSPHVIPIHNYGEMAAPSPSHRWTRCAASKKCGR